MKSSTGNWYQYACCTILASISFLQLFSQSLPLRTEPLMESSTTSAGLPGADEDLFEDRERFLKSPILLNEASREQLVQLGLLTDALIDRLLLHRQVMGPLVHLHELQAVAGFTPDLIRQLQPYVLVKPVGVSFPDKLMPAGPLGHDLLFRLTGVGSPRGSHLHNWVGGEQGILLWHRMQTNRWQAGWVLEKDPGEAILKKGRPLADHAGFHLFWRGKGWVKTFAAGDFTVHFGQGLLQWQSMALGKSADMSWLKRQGPVLRAHRSSGEINFHRGLATTLHWRNFSFTFFGSRRLLSGQVVYDSSGQGKGVKSISNSGYHRTPGEIAGRKALIQMATGGRLTARFRSLEVSLNSVYYHYSKPLIRQEAPRNIFDVQGKSWFNVSIDFSITRRNVHCFGEGAVDARRAGAGVLGLFITPASRLDVFMIARTVSPRYRAFYANAFLESSLPENESGFFLGITLRPHAHVRIDAYADFFVFPWLRYQRNAPSAGIDYLFQLNYRPHKKAELLIRFRSQAAGEANLSEPEGTPIPDAHNRIRQGWRGQMVYFVSARFRIRSRVEWLRVQSCRGPSLYSSPSSAEYGFLYNADLTYARAFWGLSLLLRYQYFDTGGYLSRIYALTPQLQPGFGVGAFYGKGSRCWWSVSKSLKTNLLLNLLGQLTPTGSSFWEQQIQLQLRLRLL